MRPIRFGNLSSISREAISRLGGESFEQHHRDGAGTPDFTRSERSLVRISALQKSGFANDNDNKAPRNPEKVHRMTPSRALNGLHLFVLVVLTMVAIESRVSAHALGQSYVFLRVDDDSVSGRFEMIVADANVVLSLDLPTDGTARWDQIEPHMEQFRSYLLDHVAMAGPKGPTPIRLHGQRLHDIDFGQFVVVDFDLDRFDEPPDYVDIHYSVLFDEIAGHQGLVVVENNWKTGTFNDEGNVALIFGAKYIDQRLDLTSSSTWRGFRALFDLGVHHIWIGIDHILFLMALLVPAVMTRENGKWLPVDGFTPAMIKVVTIVTFFTIAHSTTLSLAALDVVHLPSRLVESIIAVSIAVAALDIIVPVFGKRVWLVVLGFGLFHGFGFASVLGTMGIPTQYMALSLFGFNLGVEVGQVAIIAIAFPVLFWLRRFNVYAFPASQLAAVGLMFVSLYWFTERAFEVDLPLGSIVFGILGVK